MKVYSVIALAFAAVASFAQVDPAKTVVVINAEEVKGAEYYRRMEYLPDVGRVLDGAHVAVYPPGFLTIVSMINEHLLLQLAKQKGLLPTDQEVDDTIAETQQSNPTFKQDWINSGRTDGELRSQVRLGLVDFKLQTEGITISDQEVADFYHKESIPGLTVLPRNVTLQLIAVREVADEKKVDNDLAAGKSFSEVAKADSVDATQANGGELGTVATDRLPRVVMDAVDHTKMGETTSWIDEPVGKSDAGSDLTIHVKYHIESKALEKKLDYNDFLKNRIRRTLMLDKGKVKNNIEDELKAMRKSAKINIGTPQFAKMYEEFMRDYFHETISAGGGTSGS